TNFGNATSVRVSPTQTGLMQFDLSGLPSVAVISRATLVLFVSGVTTPGTVGIFPLTGPWTENTVTLNTAPPTGALVGAIPVSAGGQFVSLDITSLVQSWVNSPGSNFGLAAKPDAGAPSTSVTLDSKEATGTSHVAFLNISVAAQGPAGATGPQGT